jgi:hypothetical protein
MMKTQSKFPFTIPGVALGTAILILVPLVAMHFTNEVNWSAADFIIAGALLFGAGSSYVLITKYAGNMVYRLAIAGAIGSTLLMVWANLGVGLIGSGPNPGNLMYIAVIAIAIIGSFLSRFTAKGMTQVMFITATSLVLLAIVALVSGMQNYPASSVYEIIGVNAFFAALFAVTGLLFRYAAFEQSVQKPEG